MTHFFMNLHETRYVGANLFVYSKCNSLSDMKLLLFS